MSTIDLLRTVPGVVAVRSGGVGKLTGVFVRGGESTYNKVLLDGMPLNEPGGAFNFASLSPENIERIEVLRGAHSALFGSDAMASVIQLFSTRPESGRPRLLDHGRRRHLQHGPRRRRRGRANEQPRIHVFGSRLHTDNREPNNKNRTSTVSGSATHCDAVGRRRQAHGARRGRTHRNARHHGVRAARYGRAFPASRSPRSRVDGVSHSARASHTAPAIRTSRRISGPGTSPPIRHTRRASAISSPRSRHRIFSTILKPISTATMRSTAPMRSWRGIRSSRPLSHTTANVASDQSPIDRVASAAIAQQHGHYRPV